MQTALPAFLVAASLGLAPALAQDVPADVGDRIDQEREFMQMTRPAEEPEECVFQRPPEEIAETAYLRNGYEAMRRILAMERWEETGSCECFYDDITYEDAIAASERFVITSNPRVPFHVDEMQRSAADMITRRAEACGS